MCTYLSLLRVDGVNKHTSCLDRRFVKIMAAGRMSTHRAVSEADCCSDFTNTIGPPKTNKDLIKLCWVNMERRAAYVLVQQGSRLFSLLKQVPNLNANFI